MRACLAKLGFSPFLENDQNVTCALVELRSSNVSVYTQMLKFLYTNVKLYGYKC